MKLRKKHLLTKRIHEIALYEENFQSDLSAYRLTLTQIDIFVTDIDVKIAEKTELLKNLE